jgi:hypothetical protein
VGSILEIEPTGELYQDVLVEMDGRVIYGGEAFAGELKKKYEIDEVIKPKGRPKKKAQR